MRLKTLCILVFSLFLLSLSACVEEESNSSPLQWPDLLSGMNYCNDAAKDEICVNKYGAGYYALCDNTEEISCIKGCETLKEREYSCKNTTTEKLGNVDLYEVLVCKEFQGLKVWDFEDMRKCHNGCDEAGKYCK